MLTQGVRLADASTLSQGLPLVVLAYGMPDLFASRMSPVEVAQVERIWQGMQTELVTRSSRTNSLKYEVHPLFPSEERRKSTPGY